MLLFAVASNLELETGEEAVQEKRRSVNVIERERTLMAGKIKKRKKRGWESAKMLDKRKDDEMKETKRLNGKKKRVRIRGVMKWKRKREGNIFRKWKESKKKKRKNRKEGEKERKINDKTKKKWWFWKERETERKIFRYVEKKKNEQTKSILEINKEKVE